MAFLPRSLAPTYQPQLQFEPPHAERYDVLPTTQLYGPHDIDQTAAFSSQAQALGGPVVAAQHRTLQLFTLPTPTLHPSHAQFDVEIASNSQPASASTATTGPASSMGPPGRPRKQKAATLRADDWEPYKKRILELHIEQKQPLPKVRHIIEEEYGFKAELRQYRSRISKWGKDKNVKPQEMQAIVRKRQKRRLVETNRRQLVFKVRGSEVEPQKIERWMKRHDVADSFLYAPSPAASTPSAVGCHTISERGSPAMTTISVYSSAASVLSPGGVHLTGQRTQMPSPALSVSSIVRPQTSAFAGQSPAPAYRLISNLQPSFAYNLSGSGSAMDVSAQTRYNEHEEVRLRNQILEAETSLASSTLGIPDMLYKLGGVLVDQGRYRAAEDIIRRLVGSYESEDSTSDDNAETLKALSLLGRVLNLQGLHAKAERLHRRALQRRKDVLGLEHPDTLTSMSNLAAVLDEQGRYKEAEVINRETLALYKKVLGPEHPDTLISMDNLAGVLNGQGRYEETEAMLREVLMLRKKVLGPKHPKTLISIRNLQLV